MKSNHKNHETLKGLPEGVAKLQDRIFDNLPNSFAKEFPLKFIAACHKSKGKISDDITKKFFSWLLTEELAHIYEKQSDTYKNAIEQCVQAVNNDAADAAAASDAADAASDAAAAASYAARVAAAAAADADAARDASDAAAAATYASYAAAAASFAALGGRYAARAIETASYASYDVHARTASDAARDAGFNFWIRMSNKLISIIEELN